MRSIAKPEGKNHGTDFFALRYQPPCSALDLGIASGLCVIGCDGPASSIGSLSFAAYGDARPMMFLPYKEGQGELAQLFVEMFGLVMPEKIAEAVVKRDVKMTFDPITKDLMPAMYWYCWTATTALGAFVLGIGAAFLPERWSRLFWSGMVMGDSRGRDDWVRLLHAALVSTLAADLSLRS